MSKNYGTLITSPIRPFDSGMTIPTAFSNEIMGGLHSVSNLTERNNIPEDRRQFGMLVYIINDNDFYQLLQISSPNLSDNSNWSLINISGVPTTTEWLDSVISRETTPPATPSVTDRYLVTSGTGSWFGLDNLVVEWGGTTWVPTIPTEGTTLRVDNEIKGIYSYLDLGGVSPQWTFQEFVSDPFFVKHSVTASETINVGTNSHYLVFGNLSVDGQIDNWGKVVVLNGTVSGTGTVSNYGSGILQQAELLTDVTSGLGITISSPTLGTRVVSSNLSAGSGITFSVGTGSELIISQIPQNFPGGRPRHIIQSGETISVPDYEEYFIYGDLEVNGYLDIGTYGKVVVANGNLISGSGSIINNIGNVEIYDILTVADDNLKVDVSEIKYGKEGRLLFESELKYIPILGTSARVVTESDDLVYATSSAYTTSTTSTTFDRYLGLSTDDPQKKIHIVNSGILIDGIESEQDESLGDSNWARFVIDTSTSNTNTLMDLRNDQGRVLYVDGDIIGGLRHPSVSIGKTSSGTIFNVSDYYGNDYFSIGVTGSLNIGTISNDNTVDKIIGWDSTTTELKYISASLEDTGWVDLEGFDWYTGVEKPQVRRIGKVLHFRGRLYVPIADSITGEPISLVSGNSYISVADATPSTTGTGSVVINNAGSITFNQNSSVIPSSVYSGTLDRSYINQSIGVRAINVSTGSTCLSTWVRIYLLTDGKLLLQTLFDAEDTSTGSPSLYIGSSHLRLIISRVRVGEYLPAYGGTDPGTGLAGRGEGSGGSNTSYIHSFTQSNTLTNLQTDTWNATYSFDCDASDPNFLGGFVFDLDGFTSYIA